MAEAQKSSELTLHLVIKSNNRKQEARVNFELAHHLFLKTYMFTDACLHVEDSPDYTKPLLEQIVYHFRDSSRFLLLVLCLYMIRWQFVLAQL